MKASPTGIEPAHPASEADALSTELRGLRQDYTITVKIFQNLSRQKRGEFQKEGCSPGTARCQGCTLPSVTHLPSWSHSSTNRLNSSGCERGGRCPQLGRLIKVA